MLNILFSLFRKKTFTDDKSQFKFVWLAIHTKQESSLSGK
tara:strand:- start:736 stop:855 length:120 start_codon:yes stop_codon:yes gene_type:complete